MGALIEQRCSHRLDDLAARRSVLSVYLGLVAHGIRRYSSIASRTQIVPTVLHKAPQSARNQGPAMSGGVTLQRTCAAIG